MVGEAETRAPDDRADQVAPIPDEKTCCIQHGDLWRLGPHRLLCGDATDLQDMRRLINGKKVRLAFTDPPYNVSVDRHVCGLGGIRHREFAMASGEMSATMYIAFLEASLRNMAAATTFLPSTSNARSRRAAR